jgi:hypothetical protein
MSHPTIPPHDPQAWPVRDRVCALFRIFSRRQSQRILDQLDPDARHCPRLPGWFLIAFVIALGLFAADSYRQIFRWLCPRRKSATPGRSTLAMARQRLGVAPLRQLALAVVRLLADPFLHPRAFWRGRRLLGVDGFRLDLPDSPANAEYFGRPQGGRTPGAFPQARITALCELGTHVLWRWLTGPLSIGETTQAHKLFAHLPAGCLLLGDRAYGNFPVVKAVRQRKAHVLLRLKSASKFAVRTRLADGSYLSRIYANQYDRKRDRNGIEVRIIRYRLGNGKTQRLLTTLLDVAEGTAKEPIELYHSRWEEELGIDEVKTHLLAGAGLRSQTVAGVEQEIEGVLLSHYLIRVLIVEAATASGVEPTAVSFVGALEILKCRLGECRGGRRAVAAWVKEVIAEVSSEERLPPRRLRRNPRVIRQKVSKWPKKPPRKRRPKPTIRYKVTVLR